MKFGIKTLLVITFVAASCAAIYSYAGMQALVAVVLINGIGIFAGMFVTKVLGFPTDGGYRTPEIRAEYGQDVIESSISKAPIKN